MAPGDKGDCGVVRLKSLPADITTCRGVVGELEYASRYRGVDGVRGCLPRMSFFGSSLISS